jgi:hypothetical protein
MLNCRSKLKLVVERIDRAGRTSAAFVLTAGITAVTTSSTTNRQPPATNASNFRQATRHYPRAPFCFI